VTSSLPVPDPRRWLGLSIILSATLLGVLDFLIVNLALPSIQKTTGATDGQAQLTVAVYGLAFAVFLITGGRLGDIYGANAFFKSAWPVSRFRRRCADSRRPRCNSSFSA
jgi:MFS family permease